MFDKVNLEKALRGLRDESNAKVESEMVLSEFKSLFEADWEREQRIAKNISAGAVSDELLPSRNLAEDRIFELKDIKKLCLTYRLRFLSTRQFKNEIPGEALAEAKRAEEMAGSEIKAFMIAAPASAFKLQDANKDPLLFAPLEDGRFYLIHQWGGDISAFRKFVFKPLEKPLNLLITILAVSLVLSAILPTSAFTSAELGYINFYRVGFFGWNVAFLSGMVSYFWFATNQKFSVNAWNNKHFN
ncbi:MAG: hypothetical protein LC670_12520 [Flavobacteriales bacterium]|nr:hypothetical protein [Flavobacteriales bacterium]